MKSFETERLRLRPMSLDDADFILRITNDPQWLQFIGDRGVHNIQDALRFINDGPLAMYQQLGIGSLMVELKDSNVAIGSCGLLKRDYLEVPDIGYAFLPQHRSKGYGFEAASAVISYYQQNHQIDRVCAIVSPDNSASIALLLKLGFCFKDSISIDQHDSKTSLYQLN